MISLIFISVSSFKRLFRQLIDEVFLNFIRFKKMLFNATGFLYFRYVVILFRWTVHICLSNTVLSHLSGSHFSFSHINIEFNIQTNERERQNISHRNQSIERNIWPISKNLANQQRSILDTSSDLH